MLIQLGPEQVGVFWDGIRHGITQVGRITGESEELKQARVNKALENILSGKYQCWVIYDGDGEERKFYAFVLTYVYKDHLTEEESLFVDTLYGFRPMNNEMVRDVGERLTEYARGIGCTRMRAITSNKRVVEIMSICGLQPEVQIYGKEV